MAKTTLMAKIYHSSGEYRVVFKMTDSVRKFVIYRRTWNEYTYKFSTKKIGENEEYTKALEAVVAEIKRR